MTTLTPNPLNIVDISSIDKATAAKVLQSMSEDGFLLVDGHDFTQAEVDSFYELSEQFFKLPLEQKMAVKFDGKASGYTASNQESLDESQTDKGGDPKEAFNFSSFNFKTGEFDESLLPPLFKDPKNKAVIVRMFTGFYNVAMKILKLLGLGLEIDPDQGGADWFLNRNRPDRKSSTSMRLLYYPPTSELDAEKDVRCGAHTDFGTITELFQKQGEQGLELFDDVTKEWKKVPFVPSPNPEFIKAGLAPPLVINIADQLSFWTNGVLKSTLHRVRLPSEGKPRYSIAFFSNSEDDFPVSPIPSDIVKNASDSGLAIKKFLKDDGSFMTTREYLDLRIKKTYVK